MKKYFENVNTLEDLKKTYKKLAFKLHPDLGGNEEEFKNMSNEYEKMFMLIQKNSNKEHEQKENISDFKDIINTLITLTDKELFVEICGVWVWLDKNNTYEIKEQLKNIGFLWSKKKQKWYNPMEKEFKTQKHYRKNYTMQEIRNKYGSVASKIKGNKELNTMLA